MSHRFGANHSLPGRYPTHTQAEGLSFAAKDFPPNTTLRTSHIPPIPREASVEAREFRTEILHQWIGPLLSIATFLLMLTDTAVGICIVVIEDVLGRKFVSTDHIGSIGFITLIVSVTMGYQLGERKKRYDEAVENFSIITCNDNGIDEEELKRGVISFILARPAGEIMSQGEFFRHYEHIHSTVYSLPEKYKAYRAICNTVAHSHSKTLDTLIWWHINLLCAVVVPSSLNDNDQNDDFGWLVAAILIMVIAWSTYGTIVLYSDVLRPTHTWIYSNFGRKEFGKRPKGLVQSLTTVF